jgi:ArsR family transcriptional regulator, arsenate/arsenite/antimonite-responsive transcriptional repressor
MNIQEINTQADTKLVMVLKSLGDENRFQIIRLLLENDLCVGALARILAISKPAVSQHLKILREAGLVRGEKIGYWTHYRVEKELLQASARQLQELTERRADISGNAAYLCLRKKKGETDTERRVLLMCKNCCEEPGKLKTVPAACTPEQVKECHGEAKEHTCGSTCEQPEKLETRPAECTPEQIKECHGDTKKHPR